MCMRTSQEAIKRLLKDVDMQEQYVSNLAQTEEEDEVVRELGELRRLIKKHLVYGDK